MIFDFTLPEQITFEKAYLLCEDLPKNPCHVMLVGEHLKVRMLYNNTPFCGQRIIPGMV